MGEVNQHLLTIYNILYHTRTRADTFRVKVEMRAGEVPVLQYLLETANNNNYTRISDVCIYKILKVYHLIIQTGTPPPTPSNSGGVPGVVVTSRTTGVKGRRGQ